jgi:hypothetical protein
VPTGSKRGARRTTCSTRAPTPRLPRSDGRNLARETEVPRLERALLLLRTTSASSSSGPHPRPRRGGAGSSASGHDQCASSRGESFGDLSSSWQSQSYSMKQSTRRRFFHISRTQVGRDPPSPRRLLRLSGQADAFGHVADARIDRIAARTQSGCVRVSPPSSSGLARRRRAPDPEFAPAARALRRHAHPRVLHAAAGCALGNPSVLIGHYMGAPAWESEALARRRPRRSWRCPGAARLRG